METTKFSFNHYDCIGFDLDNTLARYKVGNLISLEYDIMSNFFIKKGYPSEILSKPIDKSFFVRGLIVDEENGNLLKVSKDGTILQAAHGTRWLSEEEMLKYYPTSHLKFIDAFVKNSVQFLHGAYHDKMKVLVDYFDMPNIMIFARAVDTVETFKTDKKISDIWPDILLAMIHMFSASHFQSNIGGYFPEIRSNSNRYYYESSQNVTNWLKELRKRGKKLFLLTGSYTEYANHTARQALGDNWRDYFDIVICGARKPGFFTKESAFTIPVDVTQRNQIEPQQLETGGIYEHGNFGGLRTFFSTLTNNVDLKFIYIGDHVIQDVLTPSVYSNCDTVSICEELESENIFGFQEEHPDKDFLNSPLWGSYFYSKNTNNIVNTTYWFNIIKKYCKICIPSIEYAARFPVDHEFDSFSTICNL